MNATAAAVPLKLVTVTGTVETETTLTPSVTQIHVSTLNNTRVFQEFSVSATDYALVIDINGAGLVELMPKSAGSLLPTIQVLALTNTKGMVDTKGAFGDVCDNLSSTASGNLFEGLAGTINGKVTFQKPLGSNIILKKFVFSGVATGTSQGNSTSPNALITFKVSTGSDFTQKP